MHNSHCNFSQSIRKVAILLIGLIFNCQFFCKGLLGMLSFFKPTVSFFKETYPPFVGEAALPDGVARCPLLQWYVFLGFNGSFLFNTFLPFALLILLLFVDKDLLLEVSALLCAEAKQLIPIAKNALNITFFIISEFS